MGDVKQEFLETKTFQANRTEITEYSLKHNRAIGTPVKIKRTDNNQPEEGWHIVGFYFANNSNKIEVSLIKVRKPDKENHRKGLEKTVPLESLIELNPEIESLFYDS